MIVYFDSSALVKRYLSEAESARVNSLIAQASVMGTSLISRAEVSAAIAKAGRMNWLTREAALLARQSFRSEWPSLVGVEVSESIVIQADDLAWEHGLRGYDAVHLACALSWQERLAETVTMATFDRDLWQAAGRDGMNVWPETLE
ncbi:MAG: type II toxin-antitoxin system VapC family toxin [Chloroflexi bacterium]|nr:type II toxin-antitoxin system VapC family toxin [Chloroflexota bacterium]